MGNSQGKKKGAQAQKVSTPSKKATQSEKVSERAVKMSESMSDAPQDRQDRPRKKIVLLGSGDSGKSTIAKQIKMLQLGGYSAREVQAFVPIIKQNAITAMKGFIESIDGDVLKKAIASAGSLREAVITIRSAVTLAPDLVASIQTVWENAAFHEAWKGKLNLKESATFFYENIARIAAPHYLPTSDDILRARAKTTGITELTFPYSGMDITITDVGGQKSERKKWEQCFNEVNAIIWCASLSEYDEVLYEDSSVNRMHDTLDLFEATVKSHWFCKVDILLFFNKDDLFRKKIKKIDLQECFEEYTGGCNYVNALAFIRNEFIRRTTKNHRLSIAVLTATKSNTVHKALGKVISVVVNGDFEHDGNLVF